MITGEFVRGHYFRDGRELVNLSEEGAAVMVDKPCFFCGDKSTSMLMLSDPDIGRAYTIPACGCFKERLPKKKEDLVEWASGLDLTNVAYFELKPGPVLRLNKPPYLIQKVMGELPVKIEGQIVDLGPSEAITFNYRDDTVIYFVQQGVVMLVNQGDQWMDDVLEYGPINMDDGQELAKALIGDNKVHKNWAEELMYNRLKQRYRSRQNREMLGGGLLGALMGAITGGGPSDDCDCAICTARREAQAVEEDED